MRKRIKLLLIAVFLLSFSLSAWLIGLTVFIRSTVDIPRYETLPTADAAVVLTGGSNRLDAGFELLEQGHVRLLFISGVHHGVKVQDLLEQLKGKHDKDLSCCVTLGFGADNTAGNAAESMEWMKEEGIQSVYLVTANYHMKRAMLEFTRRDPDLTIFPYAVIPDKFDVKTWWSDNTLRPLIIREYTKYLAMLFLHAVVL